MDTSGTGLADVNPFRYRGYYYDSETGYYYLNSRYYDPETGRFLNADDPAYIGDSGIEGNLYAYCGNNAVNDSDPGGNLSVKQLWDIIISCIALIAGYWSLSGNRIAAAISMALSYYYIIKAVRQYWKDHKKSVSAYMKKVFKLSFIICIAANLINIFLNYINGRPIKGSIKKILVFLATSINLALTVYYWILDLCLIDNLTYEQAKKEVKRHKC